MNPLPILKLALSMLIAVALLAGGALLLATAADIDPLALVGLDDVNTTETAAVIADGSVTVEPISLDCRARVLAEIPISARRNHEIGGRTYRTDTLTMVAIGDVDTCVDGGAHSVTVAASGATLVTIPAESIRLVRPRVDTVATAESVDVTKGIVGKHTDRFPGVSDDLGLVEEGYAVAQTVIGSSECMDAAKDETLRLIRAAYADEAVARGVDPAMVTVRIVGEVKFPPFDLDRAGIDWEIAEAACTLTAPTGEAVTR